MKRKLLNIWSIGAGGVAAVLIAAGLWDTSVVAQPAASGDSRNGKVRITYDGALTWDETRSTGRMLKNVRVTQDGEDFILYCEELTYNETKNQAVARGNLRVESRDSTITGNQIRADFNTKIIVITGSVAMRSHGSEDGIKGSNPKKATGKGSLREEVKGKASRITCDRIEYDYENQQAVITGSIRMTQGKNSGTCERILFDEEKNLAQLTSTRPYGVRFAGDAGRVFLASEVIVYIDEDKVLAKPPARMEGPRVKSTPSAPRPPRNFEPAPVIPDDPFADEPAPAAPAAAPETTTPEAVAPVEPAASADKAATENGP